jgi:hypothetical protein
MALDFDPVRIDYSTVAVAWLLVARTRRDRRSPVAGAFPLPGWKRSVTGWCDPELDHLRPVAQVGGKRVGILAIDAFDRHPIFK